MQPYGVVGVLATSTVYFRNFHKTLFTKTNITTNIAITEQEQKIILLDIHFDQKQEQQRLEQELGSFLFRSISNDVINIPSDSGKGSHSRPLFSS
jgi:hypothetical protein